MQKISWFFKDLIEVEVSSEWKFHLIFAMYDV